MDKIQMTEQKPNLIEIRCKGNYWNAKEQKHMQCNKLLAMLSPNTAYQIKCPRCGTMNEKEKEK